MFKRIRFSVALGVTTLAAAAQAAPFAPGDLAVFQAAASASNTTGSVVELDETTAGQAPLQTVALGSNFRISGSATSTAYLSHTDDRTLLTFSGVDSTNTSANVNTLNPRTVATLDASANFVEQTSYTGTSGNQTRSASSLDDTTWFIGDQGGMYSNNTTVADPLGNQRGIKAFGGVVYVGRASATLPTVSTINTPTGGTIAALPGLPNGTTAFQDYYLVQSGLHTTTYDLLYVLSATTNTAGTIEKYSLVSGSWLSNGMFTTAFGGFGLLATAVASGQTALFVTTGQGALVANSVVRLDETGGYNGPITINGAPITLSAAPAGTIYKGIDFVPGTTIVPPPPPSPPPVPALGHFGFGLAGGLLACGLFIRTLLGRVNRHRLPAS